MVDYLVVLKITQEAQEAIGNAVGDVFVACVGSESHVFRRKAKLFFRYNNVASFCIPFKKRIPRIPQAKNKNVDLTTRFQGLRMKE